MDIELDMDIDLGVGPMRTACTSFDNPTLAPAEPRRTAQSPVACNGNAFQCFLFIVVVLSLGSKLILIWALTPPRNSLGMGCCRYRQRRGCAHRFTQTPLCSSGCPGPNTCLRHKNKIQPTHHSTLLPHIAGVPLRANKKRDRPFKIPFFS